MNQRTAYIEKMELQLDKLKKKVASLETSAQEAKDEAIVFPTKNGQPITG
jgi:uncharacterized coiled-coil protein SlyX